MEAALARQGGQIDADAAETEEADGKADADAQH